VAIVVRRAW